MGNRTMLEHSNERACNNFCCRVEKPALATLLLEARGMLGALSMGTYDPPEFTNLLARIDRALEKEETFAVQEEE